MNWSSCTGPGSGAWIISSGFFFENFRLFFFFEAVILEGLAATTATVDAMMGLGSKVGHF